MAFRIDLENRPVLQLILILSLCLISVVLFSAIGGLLTIFFYGFDLSEINNYGDPNVIEGLKLFQLFSAIGLFLVPPLVYGIISSKKTLEVLSLNSLNKPINYLLVLLLMLLSTPFISWIIELNANMVLPEFLNSVEHWMRTSENQAEELTKTFLTFNGLGSLFYILIIVAVVPAIGEELLFRGVLQKIVINWTKNAHLGIWITAIFFSALHLQFFGFFPRLLLGLLFGYIFLWSKSLWVPIFGHFINNGSVVIASYFFPESINEADISIFKDSEYSIVFYGISCIISIFIFFFIRKINKKLKAKNQMNVSATV